MENAFPVGGAILGGYDAILKRNQALANRRLAAAQAYAGKEVPQEILYGQLPDFLSYSIQGGLSGLNQGQEYDKYLRGIEANNLWNENMRAKTSAYQALAQNKAQMTPEEYRQFQMQQSLKKIGG